MDDWRRRRRRIAASERITDVARIAHAYRTVIVDTARCVGAAGSDARIRALAIDAGQMRGTFAAGQALGTAGGR